MSNACSASISLMARNFRCNTTGFSLSTRERLGVTVEDSLPSRKFSRDAVLSRSKVGEHCHVSGRTFKAQLLRGLFGSGFSRKTQAFALLFFAHFVRPENSLTTRERCRELYLRWHARVDCILGSRLYCVR